MIPEKNNIPLIGLILTIVIVLILIALAIVDSFNTPTFNKQMRNEIVDACKERGYNNLTDYRKMFIQDNIRYYQIECDNNVIKEAILIARIRDSCIKKNKWGDCENHLGKKIYRRLNKKNEI